MSTMVTQAAERGTSSWSSRMRRSHRWVSVAFTITVAVNFAVLGQSEKVRLSVAYLPLLPLAVLFFSGAYLFALPYLKRRRQS